MLITLSRRTAICQSVAEVQLTGVAPLGAVSQIVTLFTNKAESNCHVYLLSYDLYLAEGCYMKTF